MYPVVLLKTREKVLACNGENPRYTPILALCFHLWKGFPFARGSSRTAAGHPKGFQCLGFMFTDVPVNAWKGVRFTGSFKFGELLRASFTILIVYGHKLGVTNDGHLLIA